MKKAIIFFCCVFLVPFYAYAECSILSKTYTSCKPGYYLSTNKCLRCPAADGIYGQTKDKNTGGITSCYLPAGTKGSDATGDYQIISDCFHSN